MIKNYFKIALRNLWRHRGFSFLNITGLAIGMTAGFLILLYVGFELSYDSFHSKGDRIYRVVSNIKTPSENIESSIPSLAVPPHLEQQFPEIEHAVRVNNIEMTVRKDDLFFLEPEVVVADSSFFKVFDFKLLQGNKDTALKEPFTMVLSETASKKYFGAENPIGKTMKVMEEGHLATVTGIMEDFPRNSHINADIVLSFTSYSQSLDREIDDQWGSYEASAYILVHESTDIDQLKSKLPAFLERNSGEAMKASQMFVTLFLEPFKEVYLHSSRGGAGDGNINNIYIFTIVGIFILIIACINFINLTTARSVERAKEVGIRKVVGAGKKQLELQFVGESIIISLIAFVLTIVLTTLLIPYFNELAGKTISDGIFSQFSYIPILFALSLGIGALAGIYPAFVLSSFKPVSVLKGSFSTGKKGVLLRKGLVITQFTISIALIIGTIIIYHQMSFMRNQELGFNKEQTIILNTNASSSQLALKDVIDKLPGVQSTSLTSSTPGTGNPAAYSEIQNKNGDLQVANLDLYFVDEDYIPQFDLKVVAGRAFSKEFATDSTSAMVVNEKAVSLLGYSSPQEAIGANFRQWGREGKIIGVVQDFHFQSLQQPINPLTMRLEPSRTSLITVKVAPHAIPQTLASIKKEWQRLLPDAPFDHYFLDEIVDQQYRTEQRFGNLFLNFAILAIFISCMGLLGLAAYSTLQRKREIGVRKVLGSSITGVVGLLSAEFMKLVGTSFLIAAPIAWFFMHYWLEDFAYRITIQWWVFVLAGISALFITLLTVSFHAIKVAVINPVKSLRTE